MNLGDELRAVTTAWDAATKDGTAAFGATPAGAAYQRMQRAWASELAAQAILLDRLDARPMTADSVADVAAGSTTAGAAAGAVEASSAAVAAGSAAPGALADPAGAVVAGSVVVGSGEAAGDGE